jgi:hypothetical protein
MTIERETVKEPFKLFDHTLQHPEKDSLTLPDLYRPSS